MQFVCVEKVKQVLGASQLQLYLEVGPTAVRQYPFHQITDFEHKTVARYIVNTKFILMSERKEGKKKDLSSTPQTVIFQLPKNLKL